ncbi:nucleoside-diphosphate-sugar epimerase [Mucilaginibacter oryzae]|uniref:Nucleoside-diphosphate-sugar epimerase n=1 Tax=Mucilaginibacter oryzae TaxID=468058 RepID=A0A316GYR4_9SPHI|nr:SDR family oxidoreductase [Mucilaginibacter oryzae]PWK69988.1 nucleoside-diphosphate-sugar epimerase [Mucilaginibacter oryzae]
MRVFVTGASGFVGSAIVKELLSAGHQVLGMVRSDAGAEKVAALGAEVHRGDLYDLESIKNGAAVCDAVIHTAFNHDFSKFKDNCETDRQVIEAIASVLEGTDRPLVVTSGIGLFNGIDHKVTEDENPSATSATVPRLASEEAARAAQAKGVNAYILRLPPTTHDAGDHGFVPMIINMAKEKGVSAYINDGANLWPAVHRQDAAVLYRLIIEQKPALRNYHAVAEEGFPFKEIAKAIGEGLHLPVESKTGDDIAAHFGWFSYFAGMGCEASSAKTSEVTGWEPKHIGLMEDLQIGGYLK